MRIVSTAALLLIAVVLLHACGDGAGEYLDQITDETAHQHEVGLKQRYQDLAARSRSLPSNVETMVQRVRIGQDLNLVKINLYAKSKMGLNTVSLGVYQDLSKKLNDIEAAMDALGPVKE